MEETERGWYIQYIERDPFLLERQEQAQRRDEAERIQEIKTIRRMEQQRAEAAAALDRVGGVLSVEASKLDRSNVGTVSISLGGLKGKTALVSKTIKKGNSESLLQESEFISLDKKRRLEGNLGDVSKYNKETKKTKDDDVTRKTKKQISALEQIMLENKSNAQREQNKYRHDKHKNAKIDNVEELKDRRKENWVREGIVVRIISKKLAKKSYYKQKGVVEKVKDKFIATILLEGEDCGTKVMVDQRDLETVVPKVGREVLIVNGKGRGQEAVIESMDKNNYKANLALTSGSKQTVNNVDYEDVSELA